MKRTQKKYQFFKKDEEDKLKKIKMRIIYGQLIKKNDTIATKMDIC